MDIEQIKRLGEQRLAARNYDEYMSDWAEFLAACPEAPSPAPREEIAQKIQSLIRLRRKLITEGRRSWQIPVDHRISAETVAVLKEVIRPYRVVSQHDGRPWSIWEIERQQETEEIERQIERQREAWEIERQQREIEQQIERQRERREFARQIEQQIERVSWGMEGF